MADRRRRRRRASQDSEEEEEEEESGSEKSPALVERAAQPSTRAEGREPVPSRRGEAAREGKESECESEDGIEGDAVLSDYESAESEEEEAHLSEEDALKTTLKAETNATENPVPKEEKPKSKGAVTGERQSGDGQESTEPDEDKASKKSQKQLDDDEDRKNPAYIPRKGLFFEHDLRGHTNDEEVRPKGRHPRKLWKDEGRWEHDRFREDEQAPKSRNELVSMYGYDIRSCKNPEEIRPRRPRKPRYSSPPREDQEEKPTRPSNRYQESNSAPPPRVYNNRSAPNNNRTPPNRTYPRPGYKENRPTSYPLEDGVATPSSSDRRQDYGGYRGRSTEQPLPQPSENSTEVQNKPEPATEKQAEDPSPPPPDRPVEKKSYSRARRSRIKGGEAGKSIDDATFPDLPPPPLPPIPAEVLPEPSPPIPVVKSSGWEPPVEGSVTGLEQDMSQVNISDQNWSPGQPPYISARGIPNHIHMAAGPPQYNRMEGMGVQSGRVKRYSSQRQRPVPDPAPMHISLMEGHYYDPLQFQGPIYAHGDSPSSIPPQGMIVPQEMHLPHPGLHPHQSPAPMTSPMPTPNLYPGPVSIPPGQPPPQQLLPPPYFTAPPSVINFGNPSYPYPPAPLPPPPAHLYPNPQAQSQVYGGVTYYNPVQQQVQPKPSPPRRTSQPVTVKPPPPEENRHLKAKEKSSA